MGSPIAAPQHPAAESSKEPFLGIPLKGWAVFVISLIAVCAAFAHYSIGVLGDIADLKRNLASADTKTKQLALAKSNSDAIVLDTSEQTDLITREIQKHAHDNSGKRFTVHKDPAGDVVATYFESDGCVALARPGPQLPYLEHSGDRVKWFLAQTMGGEGQQSVSSSRLPMPKWQTGSSSIPWLDAVLAPRNFPPAEKVRLRNVNSQGPNNCLNPHPGPFQSSWGPARGCNAPLTRTWSDRCSHYQIYNSCSGKWDPTIHWTVCSANHHP